jgi:hypothetical protein
MPTNNSGIASELPGDSRNATFAFGFSEPANYLRARYRLHCASAGFPIEGEMLDSTSGERMVAFITSKGGRRWFSGLKGFKKWADIEAAFRSWAKEFRERLDEAHGR